MTRRLIARIGLGIAFTTVVATAATVPASAGPVAAHPAVLKGQVFADANSSAHADPGEGLRGAALKVSNFSTNKTYRITAGAKGRFRTVVPTGDYYLSGGTKRWKVIPKSFHLHADGRDFALRAVRPLGHVLTAKLHFTKHRYAPGDRVHVVVTLTNSGSKLLRGINAGCNRAGFPDELVNRGPGWGKLAFDRSGVALNAHTTREFDIHAKVPPAATRSGQVVVACDFGYRGLDAGYRPQADDTAKVPGRFGALVGDVGHYRPGHPNHLIGLAHVRIVLVNPDTCPVYTRRTSTDADGHFHIRNAPAGSTYQIYIFPPDGWKVRHDDPTGALIFGNDTTHFTFEVAHGSKHVPNPPTTC